MSAEAHGRARARLHVVPDAEPKEITPWEAMVAFLSIGFLMWIELTARALAVIERLITGGAS